MADTQCNKDSEENNEILSTNVQMRINLFKFRSDEV